jgi:hypothetical protein
MSSTGMSSNGMTGMSSTGMMGMSSSGGMGMGSMTQGPTPAPTTLPPTPAPTTLPPTPAPTTLPPTPAPTTLPPTPPATCAGTDPVSGLCGALANPTCTCTELSGSCTAEPGSDCNYLSPAVNADFCVFSATGAVIKTPPCLADQTLIQPNTALPQCCCSCRSGDFGGTCIVDPMTDVAIKDGVRVCCAGSICASAIGQWGYLSPCCDLAPTPAPTR